jgi:hypothetical protein
LPRVPANKLVALWPARESSNPPGRVFGCLKQVDYKFGRWLDVVYMELVLDAAKKKLKRRKRRGKTEIGKVENRKSVSIRVHPWFDGKNFNYGTTTR